MRERHHSSGEARDETRESRDADEDPEHRDRR